MTTTIESGDAGRDALGQTQDRRLVFARLAIGLAQGVALYLLFRTTEGASPTWSARHAEMFGTMVLVALFLPLVLLAGVGRLRLITLAVWTGVAGAALAGLAWHDVARQAGDVGRELTFPLFAFSAAALFIAHHLIVPADRERRRIAAYPSYFDAAWMAGVQLALSLAFAGAFWLLLFLGAALFKVIGLTFLSDLIGQEWFSFPVTGLAFAVAVQLTDVRDGLIRGVRTIALMLLSWLLLVLTVLVGGFLAALPFTGLEGLWRTGSATALVLAAAGGLIILINAAYQDGRLANLPPAILRIAVRVASVLLTPLVAIAVWGLALRIGQHGLTPDRIIAVACALVGAIYAAGYGYAALRPFWTKDAQWMRPLERANIFAAVATVGVVLALFSPLADPARLSVADQINRLEKGKVAADAFDYDFLHSGSGKAGQAALARLAASEDADVAARARSAQAGIIQPRPTPDFTPVIGVLPGAPALPPTLFDKVSIDDARRQCEAEGDCLAAWGEALGFPARTILLVQQQSIIVYVEDAEFGTYAPLGAYTPLRCGHEPPVDARDLLRDGRLRAGLASLPNLETGGARQSPVIPSAGAYCD
jgi:hypothetical protein